MSLSADPEDILTEEVIGEVTAFISKMTCSFHWLFEYTFQIHSLSCHFRRLSHLRISDDVQALLMIEAVPFCHRMKTAMTPQTMRILKLTLTAMMASLFPS